MRLLFKILLSLCSPFAGRARTHVTGNCSWLPQTFLYALGDRQPGKYTGRLLVNAAHPATAEQTMSKAEKEEESDEDDDDDESGSSKRHTGNAAAITFLLIPVRNSIAHYISQVISLLRAFILFLFKVYYSLCFQDMILIASPHACI